MSVNFTFLDFPQLQQPTHFLYSFLVMLCSLSQSCPTLCDPMDCSPPGSSIRGDSPGKNTGVGCYAFL